MEYLSLFYFWYPAVVDFPGLSGAEIAVDVRLCSTQSTHLWKTVKILSAYFLFGHFPFCSRL